MNYRKSFVLCYDEPEEKPTEPPTEAPPPAGGKTFTQEEVNRIMAENKRKLQTENKTLLEKLTTLEQNVNLTAQEKAELQEEIESLRQRTHTAEELAAQERQKLEKKSKEEIDLVSKDRDGWKNRYSSAMIRASITDAAMKSEAFNPAQILAILAGNAVIEEAKDAKGQPTGEFVPMVKVQEKGETLVLTPEQAVKRMVEDVSNYGNLFRSTKKGGSGSYNDPGTGGKLNPKALAGNMAAYREAKKQGIVKA